MLEATGAQIIVELLKRQGITKVAGLPGGMILPLYDELAKSSIEHILVRHEQAAGFIAQGMARTTGKAAVCLATSGPGAMNLLTAIADARSDSIPLVAITGQVTTNLIGTDAFQEADTFGLSFPITKHSVMVKSAKELLEVIPNAFTLAESDRPGPVLIDVPRDVQLEKITFEKWPEIGEKQHRAAKRYRTEGESLQKSIEKIGNLLQKSENPILFIGGGCNTLQGAAALNSFLDSFPIPTVSTLMGVSVLPKTHPCFVGMLGIHGRLSANYGIHHSDLIIALGVRFDDRATCEVSKFAPSAKIVHIDIDAAEINKIFHTECSLVSDVESVLPVLQEYLREIHFKLSAKIKKWSELLSAKRKEDENAEKTRIPCKIMEAVSQALISQGYDKESVIATTDVGQHQMWAAQYFPLMAPCQFLTSGSLGTMGFGLPSAIGASLSFPEKRVVCFTGDGSIMMNLQELATIAENNLDITVVLLDNGALGMVRQQQELMFDKNYSASIFKKTSDFITISEGFGIPAKDVALENLDDANWKEFAFPKKRTGPRFVRIPVPQLEKVFPFVPGNKGNTEPITE
ncbi:MAG: biosynthetic-type acetolactate synthase large subunit [Spirochaetaceae bacterium]|nr:biosynthetic-type acetolactate synthase large subunit [Spirochaetaceae bacterium]